jgi:tRNA-specific 2-thiouridylase
VELVTIGQRRGLGGAHAEARYAINVDVPRRTITIGSLADLHVEVTELADVVWIGEAVDRITAQTSAHGHAEAATVNGAAVVWDRPHRRVAPGQSVVLYDGDLVVGWGLAV